MGGPSKAQVAGPHWRSPFRGWHVPAIAPCTVEQRIVEAAALLPEGGALTGWAALRWAGSPWFDGTRPDGALRPVPLVLPRGAIRRQPGVELTSELIRVRESVNYDGLSLTPHNRSVAYEMRHTEDVRLAVVALDMGAYSDFASIAEVAAHLATIPRRRGVRHALEALVFGEENSWSPMESIMRLHYQLDAGLPRPLCNVPVFDREGRHLGTPDLLDLEAGLVCEYDGLLHLAGRRRAQDLKREHLFRQVGLELVTMVASDHQSPLTTIVPRIVESRGRARFEAASARSWTVVPPPWWTDTTTVAARRSLTPGQFRRLLRYRRT